MRVFVLVALLLVACGSTTAANGGQAGAGGEGTGRDPASAGTGGEDASLQCFPCEGYWICGGDVARIDLVPQADGCLLSGLPGRNLLAPDGVITSNEVVVGKAEGTGARIRVAHPDGSQWLFCAGGSGCP